MRPTNSPKPILLVAAAFSCLLVLAGSGCHSMPHRSITQPGHAIHPEVPVYSGMPKELSKVVLPEYVIEPPDILVVDALHIVPRPPYELRSGDVLSLQVQGTLPDAPITGAYPIEPGGVVNLGYPYGTVKVSGLTTDQARQAIQNHLLEYLREPYVSASLLQMAGLQQIAGEHLVGPDGTVTLGSYGKVTVVGMTVEQAKGAIEAHLSQYLEEPVVAVDVFAYNSKVYYIITQGAGMGDGVVKMPFTGNETVLDAVANINGFSSVSSKRIWIARPSATGEVQVLPVDWDAIAYQGSPLTNYQLLPGDRLFVAEDQLVAFDTGLAKVLAPFERIFGFTLLGTGTVSRLSGKVLENNRQGGNFGGGF